MCLLVQPTFLCPIYVLWQCMYIYNSMARELAGNEKSSASLLQQLQRLLSSEITSCYSDIGFAVHVGICNPSSNAHS